MLGNMLLKNSAFVGIRSIVKKYFSMFSKEKGQLLIVWLFPGMLALGIGILNVADKDMYQNIIVAVSIFVSMLFAMMSILTTRDLSVIEDVKQRERAKSVLRETNNSILFSVCLAVFEIILCLVSIATEKLQIDVRGLSIEVGRILWIVVVYLFEVVLLNMMIIVKRLSKIMNN